jgi:hypothetical protein
MAAWFPNGVKSGDVIHKIVPGGYAVVGKVSNKSFLYCCVIVHIIFNEMHKLPTLWYPGGRSQQ